MDSKPCFRVRKHRHPRLNIPPHVAIVFALLFVALPGCVAIFAEFKPPSNPDDTLTQGFGNPIEPFTLTDQDNEPFSSDRLRGKIWVAHFFFTTCTGGCTKTTPTMAELQKLIRGKPDLALVSISLNNDTPEDLKKFAEGLEAEPGQWFFLTGDKAQVHKLVQTSFGQTARIRPIPSLARRLSTTSDWS